MPSASAKLEKQTSTEVVEPLKQVLTMIEHKKRNLEKRKGKLEAYKTEQKNGKELNSEQQSAVAKYDEVIQTLAFANDLVKQIQQLEVDHAKVTKKQQKKDLAKEQSDKYQRDIQRTKDIIIIQDVLQSFEDELVRSDFLEGKNGAVVVTQEDVDVLEKLACFLFPKKSGNDEIVSGAAQSLVNLLDKKKKEWSVTTKTYAEIFDLIMTVNNCDYFRNIKNVQTATPVVQEPEPEEVDVVEIEDTLVDPAIIKKEISGSPSLKTLPPVAPLVAPLPIVDAPLMAPPVETPYFVAAQVAPPPQHFVPPPQQPPVHLPPRQTISDVIGQSNSAFDFLQESQIEAEPPAAVMMAQFPPGMAPPTAPAASAVPQPDFIQAIPSQTFTNQSFQVMAQGAVPPPQAPHPQSVSPKTTMQPYPPTQQPPAFIEETQPLQQRSEEPKQPATPASFAQAATYSSLTQQPKPQNITNGPPGFPPQQQKVQQQSQFQPIPTLEQEQEKEKESNTWNGAEGDDQQQRGGFRGKGGGRGGRGRGGADRNGYGSRPRQNGQGRPGGYRQDRPEGEKGSYENGVSDQKGGSFRRGPPKDGPREFREPREPREYREPREPREFREPREPREFREPREPRENKEWKDSREWRDQKEPRDNSGGRRGPRPNGQFRGGRGRGAPGGNPNPRPQQSQPVKQQQ
ncbi:caprin homolog [Neocloeon triangulifer]|uniref:caprin homolog n=1 Tax=Neocloeon triangulifer TaxID=2078957 RepID=UPI00286F6E00|nr:caprin homolog [Neocloeon triangulifer]